MFTTDTQMIEDTPAQYQARMQQRAEKILGAVAHLAQAEPITPFRTANSPTETFRIWPHRIRLRLPSPVRFPAREARGAGVFRSRRQEDGARETGWLVTPLRAGRLFALASVEIDIDGVRIEVHGIRAMRVLIGATKVKLPTFCDAAGQSRAAIVLPDEVHGPIGDAVIEALIERGLAKRRFSVPIPD
jgi:hypothetical protein